MKLLHHLPGFLLSGLNMIFLKICCLNGRTTMVKAFTGLPV